MIGVLVMNQDVRRGLEVIEQADAAGVQAAWLTTVGAARDALELLAAAAVRTHQIKLGTAVIPTWPRHPVVIAQQAQVVDALAPGRLMVGVGPGNRESMEAIAGARWRKPLVHLREYVRVLKALLSGEAVDFEGEQISCHAQAGHAVVAPVYGSALQPGSYRVCGEVADGAISWMQSWSHVRDLGLPALREGAKSADRAVPGVLYHVPFCVTENRQAAIDATRRQLGFYARLPAWAAMYASAGVNASGDYEAAYLEDYVVSGNATQVSERLRGLLADGADQVIGVPVLLGDEAASLRTSIQAAADAAV